MRANTGSAPGSHVAEITELLARQSLVTTMPWEWLDMTGQDAVACKDGNVASFCSS
jgi:hypothetical protein